MTLTDVLLDVDEFKKLVSRVVGRKKFFNNTRPTKTNLTTIINLCSQYPELIDYMDYDKSAKEVIKRTLENISTRETKELVDKIWSVDKAAGITVNESPAEQRLQQQIIQQIKMPQSYVGGGTAIVNDEQEFDVSGSINSIHKKILKKIAEEMDLSDVILNFGRKGKYKAGWFQEGSTQYAIMTITDLSTNESADVTLYAFSGVVEDFGTMSSLFKTKYRKFIEPVIQTVIEYAPFEDWYDEDEDY